MRKVHLLLVVLFCSLAVAASSFSLSGIKTIETAELHSMIVDNAFMLEKGREQRFIVIDARAKKEFDKAHIFSAVSIPAEDLEKSMKLLPKDKGRLLIVYSNNPKCDKSRKWAERAAAAGYRNVAVYLEGFTAWKGKKMPVVPF